MRDPVLPGLGLLDRSSRVPRVASFRPAFDVVEHPDRYEVVADVPGVARERVEVEFQQGALHVRGERAGEALPESARVAHRGRRHGGFHLTVAFGDDVEVERIEATCRDGVLRVDVPKHERTRPRQIPVVVH